jgi:hypothetical protein
MGAIEKEEKFKNELVYIKNPKIKAFAEKAIAVIPDYFYDIPASSTGKYHPAYTVGDGGLYRHTKAAIRIAIELFRTDNWHFTTDEQDLIITSLILHDGFKSGENHEVYTRADHPNIMMFAIKKNFTTETSGLEEDQLGFIEDNIQTHMGKWNTDFKNPNVELMPKPKTEAQLFVHLADYLASRKCLLMDFTVPLSRE